MLLSTFFFNFKTGLKLVWRDFIGEVDLFAPSFGDKEAIIFCSVHFDLKKKNLKKKQNKTKQNKTNTKTHPPAPTQKKKKKKKSCGGQPNDYFCI